MSDVHKEKVDKEISITPVGWSESHVISIPAKPEMGSWTKIADFVRSGTLIRLEVQRAQGTPSWKYGGAAECTCGPDGDPTSLLTPQNCLMAAAPVGALIAKVGGSIAGQSDGKLFLAGSFAVLALDSSTSGPLYLTINDEPSGMSENQGTLLVKIQMAKAPDPPPAPAKPNPGSSG